MGCRIGMTTNLEQRKAYWESQYSSLTDWQILEGPFSSKEIAQRKETELANKHNCDAHPGGDDPDFSSAKWYVYGFNF